MCSQILRSMMLRTSSGGHSLPSYSTMLCSTTLPKRKKPRTLNRCCDCFTSVHIIQHFSVDAKTPMHTLHYDKRDAILYALGVGATLGNCEDFKFLYEGHADFTVLPTYFVVPSLKTFQDSDLIRKVFPGRNISSAHLLHGEQYLEILKPVQTSGTLHSRAKVLDILDKGSGAVIILDVETFTEEENMLAFNQLMLFVVGAGGFGGLRNSEKVVVKPITPPSRTPDASVVQKTSCDQAAIYRLSGDWSPLHIDPSCASVGGFSCPILQGLCTLGFSARHILQQYANNDALKFKAIKVRFVKPAYPGQTLQTNMWQEDKRIHFETKVSETGTTVISGAYVDLTDVPVPK